MKKVLILGAGMVVKPMVHYLLDNNIDVTIASRTKSKADKMLEGYVRGKAITETGVHIPIKKSIYFNILNELKKHGISMEETITIL